VSATLRIGTRGSTLALRQTGLVVDELRRVRPGLRLEVMVIRTAGDARGDVPITELGDGAFVKAFEAALLDRRIDLAVHSAKDVPVEQEPDSLSLAAFPARADPRDALVSREHHGLDDLPPMGRVATGSPRRAAQLKFRRPDLSIVGVRGNVDTRICKLRRGEADALVVAAAGLERLGRLDEATQLLPVDVLTPAAGQGALVAQCRAEDQWLRALLAEIDHAPTRQAVLAERALLRRLGGGCKVPVGALARLAGDRLTLRGVLAASDGRALVVEELDGPVDRPEELGRLTAERLIARGASLLAESARG
jgi:hydroxymethylbilane synthase